MFYSNYSVEFARLDVVVESCVTSVEYAAATPTVTVSGISWENGVLDSVVKLWEIIVGMFHVWEFPLHGVWGYLAELWWEGLVWTPRRTFPRIPSAGSWERSCYAIAVGT